MLCNPLLIYKNEMLQFPPFIPDFDIRSCTWSDFAIDLSIKHFNKIASDTEHPLLSRGIQNTSGTYSRLNTIFKSEICNTQKTRQILSLKQDTSFYCYPTLAIFIFIHHLFCFVSMHTLNFIILMIQNIVINWNWKHWSWQQWNHATLWQPLINLFESSCIQAAERGQLH